MAMFSSKIVSVICVSLLLTGCETTDGAAGSQPRTAMDRAIGQCVLSVGAGAILGALIGSGRDANGNSNSGRGAMIGAAAGAGVCAVLMAMAHEKDKQQLAAAQQAALQSGQAQSVQYSGDDGSARLIRISSPTAVADPLSTNGSHRNCRAVGGSLAVSGVGSTAAPQQLYCEDSNGDWSPS